MRELTQQEVDEILALKNEDITMSLLKLYFSGTVKNPKPRFKVTDYFRLPANTCSKNLEGYTTIGLYMFNRLVTDVHFAYVTGYINVPITGKTLNKLYGLISQAFYEDKITSDQFFELIDILEFLGGGDLSEIINVSLSNKLFILPPKIKQRRDELFKKYEKQLTAGGVEATTIATKIEEELLNMTRDYLKTLPEWDNFASDAKLSFDNNYKTVMLMKGPLMNTGTGEWEIAKSNYDDGIQKEEYALFADSSVYGTFQRAKGVELGGYAVKKFIATLQDVKAAEPGSDCGTKDCLTIEIDPYFKNELMYMYIMEGNKLVLLTPENFSKYEGKEVKMRSPMYCKHPKPNLCNKCIGEHPYRMNLKNVGLAATKIGSTLMNRRLKAFHNKKVHIYNIDVDDLF